MQPSSPSHGSAKIATCSNTGVSGYGHVPIKLYLYKQAVGHAWPQGHSLLALIQYFLLILSTEPKQRLKSNNLVEAIGWHLQCEEERAGFHQTPID